jgi:hypothetical protein
MIAPVGVFLAAATLSAPVPAALPAQGLVVSERGGITFVDFGGRRLGHVNGLRFAWQDTNVSSGLPSPDGIPRRRPQGPSFRCSNSRGAPESGALGWLRDGSAVVHFPVGACGRSLRTPGTYVIPRSGKPRLVLATTRLAAVAMWGG